jgi:hypothetical protein
MAVIHNTTLTPSKLELLNRWLPAQSWFAETGDLSKAGGFRLDDPDGEVGIEFMIVRTGGGDAYLVPMSYRGAALDGADDALIGTSQHGVLGRRWVYDGERDPVVRSQLAALLRGEVAAQAQSASDSVDPTVQVRPVQHIASLHVVRLLQDGVAPPQSGGYVAAPWRRADDTVATGTVATAT